MIATPGEGVWGPWPQRMQRWSGSSGLWCWRVGGNREGPGQFHVPHTEQLQVREDVHEVHHAGVSVDLGPQERSLVSPHQGGKLVSVTGLQGVCHFV